MVVEVYYMYLQTIWVVLLPLELIGLLTLGSHVIAPRFKFFSLTKWD